MTNPPPSPPVLPASGEALYNELMGQIEPELTFPAITSLAEKYAAETPEQRTERSTRYKKAFEEYAKRYEQVRTQMSQGTKDYGRQMLMYVEGLWRGREHGLLQDISNRISTF